jgi:hypothetical protein
MSSQEVYDEKNTGVYDAEKTQYDTQPAGHNAANPHFPGKNTEYAIEVAPAGNNVHDAVFGDVGEDGPNYRAVSSQD